MQWRNFLAKSGLPRGSIPEVADWMAEHMAEEFSPARLAERAGMSEFRSESNRSLWSVFLF
jgi:transcriptional regulator GlxA family with amidase domain